MSKLPFTKDFAFEIVEEYLLHILDVMWSVANYGHLNNAKKQFLGGREESILDAVFTYAETGIWRGPTPDEALLIFEDLFEMQVPDYLNCGVHDRRKELEPLVDLMTTRFQVDPFEGVHIAAIPEYDPATIDFSAPENSCYLVSRKSLALLEGKTEETIRAAMYVEGDRGLKPVRDDQYSPVDIKRWQIAIGSFQPSLYYRSVEFEPKHGFTDINNFRRWLCAFGEEQQTCKTVKAGEIRALLPSASQSIFTDFINSDDEAVSWFNMDVAVKMAELLQVSPRWLAESVFKVFDPVTRRHQIECTMPSSEAFKSRLVSQAAASLADEAPATPENLISLLASCDWLETHPLQRKATAKISGYLAASGVTVLHEHNLKRQYVWLPRDCGEALSLSKQLYPSSDLGKDGRYGRNSGIKKFDAVAFADLYRVQVENCGDLRLILDQIK